MLARSIPELQLLSNERYGSWQGVWRRISWQDLELKLAAGNPANHLHNICQCNVSGIYKGIASLRQGKDSVSFMKLPAEFGRSARQHIQDYRVPILRAESS